MMPPFQLNLPPCFILKIVKSIENFQFRFQNRVEKLNRVNFFNDHMKILLISSWLVFITGVTFQFLQLPGTAIVLLTSVTLFLVHGYMLWREKAKHELPLTLTILTLSLISIYIAGRFHFWMWTRFVFFIVCGFAAAALLFSIINRVRMRLVHLFLLIYFCFFLWFSFLPSHQLYYAIRLNTLLNKESRNTDYRSWDKYSWFLNIKDHHAEAIEANRQALNAVGICRANSDDHRAEEYQKLIEKHKFQLEHNQWIEYP